MRGTDLTDEAVNAALDEDAELNAAMRQYLANLWQLRLRLAMFEAVLTRPDGETLH